MRWTRERGVLGIHKTNYVVKTTELAEKPRAVRGNGVFWGFTKRITLLKKRNSQRNRAAGAETGCFRDSQNELRCFNNGIGGGNRAVGAVSKGKAVRAAARCQKSVRKTQIGRARRHYPHGGEVTRQKLCAGKMRGGNSASGQAGNHIIGIPAASSATYGIRQCGDSYSSPFFHYYNIIVRLSGFFRSRPESPVIRAFRLVKSACFISLRRGLTNISCGGIISAQKNKCSFRHAGCTRTIVRYHRAVILTAKQNKCSINPEEVMNF